TGAVPAGLPAHVAVGLGNFDLTWPNASGVPWGYRYQYLSGGVNTGSGWSTWNAPAGEFALLYMNASFGAGMIPVFDYYQLRGSSPNVGSENPDPKLQNGATMNAYFADYKLLMQKCGQYDKTVIVHIEPDFWGFCQNVHGDDPSVIAVSVAASGFADVSAYHNNLPGFAQALVHLRDLYAPKAVLALHASHWGAGGDLILNNLDPIVHANRTGGYFNALGASFELLFHDPSDRDAGFKQAIYGDGGASWWDASDFDRYRTYLGQMWAVTGRRGILWQMPVGNTVMKTCDNTWGHYQDNRAEYFLLAANKPHVVAYASSGVIALLFGPTDDGTTHYHDNRADGVTNGGSGTTSTSPDDDGGFLRTSTGAYYGSGPVSLP
ncbi:MAG: hypothetical protein HY293_18965, partial [Planctomycetes bacterium]|nr:hypothetical protein [Planctomycetota bacterium]